ncbi:hypothetical protein PR048_005057 [Dryococelus australis]|uniref:Uncharacterized protein n=1 Tax=Dryococelus australis TaxID=614101 RepID=A0ABQ9I7M3_9NEOP|nr:hypothetical protein PR048_005057 [Dryococelus australis]
MAGTSILAESTVQFIASCGQRTAVTSSDVTPQPKSLQEGGCRNDVSASSDTHLTSHTHMHVNVTAVTSTTVLALPLNPAYAWTRNKNPSPFYFCAAAAFPYLDMAGGVENRFSPSESVLHEQKRNYRSLLHDVLNIRFRTQGSTYRITRLKSSATVTKLHIQEEYLIGTIPGYDLPRDRLPGSIYTKNITRRRLFEILPLSYHSKRRCCSQVAPCHAKTAADISVYETKSNCALMLLLSVDNLEESLFLVSRTMILGSVGFIRIPVWVLITAVGVRNRMASIPMPRGLRQTACLITPLNIKPGYERNCNNSLRKSHVQKPLPPASNRGRLSQTMPRYRPASRWARRLSSSGQRREMTQRWVCSTFDKRLPETAYGTMIKEKTFQLLSARASPALPLAVAAARGGESLVKAADTVTCEVVALPALLGWETLPNSGGAIVSAVGFRHEILQGTACAISTEFRLCVSWRPACPRAADASVEARYVCKFEDTEMAELKAKDVLEAIVDLKKPQGATLAEITKLIASVDSAVPQDIQTTLDRLMEWDLVTCKDNKYKVAMLSQKVSSRPESAGHRRGGVTRRVSSRRTSSRAVARRASPRRTRSRPVARRVSTRRTSSRAVTRRASPRRNRSRAVTRRTSPRRRASPGRASSRAVTRRSSPRRTSSRAVTRRANPRSRATPRRTSSRTVTTRASPRSRSSQLRQSASRRPASSSRRTGASRKKSLVKSSQIRFFALVIHKYQTIRPDTQVAVPALSTTAIAHLISSIVGQPAQLEKEHCTLAQAGDEHLYAKTRLGKVKEAAGVAERRMEGARVCEPELVASSSHQTALGRGRGDILRVTGFPAGTRRGFPEKARRRAASSSTTPTCENPGASPPWIQPGSSRWEASALATAPPLSLIRKMLGMELVWQVKVLIPWSYTYVDGVLKPGYLLTTKPSKKGDYHLTFHCWLFCALRLFGMICVNVSQGYAGGRMRLFAGPTSSGATVDSVVSFVQRGQSTPLGREPGCVFGETREQPVDTRGRCRPTPQLATLTKRAPHSYTVPWFLPFLAGSQSSRARIPGIVCIPDYPPSPTPSLCEMVPPPRVSLLSALKDTCNRFDKSRSRRMYILTGEAMDRVGVGVKPAGGEQELKTERTRARRNYTSLWPPLGRNYNESDEQLTAWVMGKRSKAARGPLADLLASHQDEPGSIPGRFTPDFRNWESCRKLPLAGGFSRDLPGSPRPFIPALLHPHRTSPPSAIKTSMLRSAQISSFAQSLTFNARTACVPPSDFLRPAGKFTANIISALNLHHVPWLNEDIN